MIPGPVFVKIPSGEVLLAGRRYSSPEMATHVGVFKGKVAFFMCLSPEFLDRDYKGLKWHFFAIPLGIAAVCFPDYCFKVGPGYFYGQPVWWPFADKAEESEKMVTA